MIADGAVETRPGDDDPGAIALLHRLARVSRRRWPETAVPMPRRLPEPAELRTTCESRNNRPLGPSAREAGAPDLG